MLRLQILLNELMDSSGPLAYPVSMFGSRLRVFICLVCIFASLYDIMIIKYAYNYLMPRMMILWFVLMGKSSHLQGLSQSFYSGPVLLVVKVT